MKYLLTYLFSALLLTSVSVTASDNGTKTDAEDSLSATVAEESDSSLTAQVVVYYLHGNRRCATCKKLETFSEEAVRSGFAEQLEDSVVVWQVVNFEEEGNEHYARDYKLYSQSLVLSRVNDGKEVEWRNLDKIWTLVGNKEEFLTYVESELQSFLGPAVRSTDEPADK